MHNQDALFDDTAQQEAEQTFVLKQLQEQEDLRWIVNQPAGRRFFGHLLQKTNALGASYVADSAYTTAYNEGVRCIGLYLLHLVSSVAPEHAASVLLGESYAVAKPKTQKTKNQRNGN